MSTGKLPHVVLGLANVGDTSKDPMARFGTAEDVRQMLETFCNRGYKFLDSARNYPPHAPGTCEPLIGAALQIYTSNGETPIPILSSKIPSWDEYPHSRSKIDAHIGASLKDLRLSQVDIEYLHQPDPSVPLEETCDAMNTAYLEGKFRRFGLSNYSTEDIEKIIAICEEHGYVKPTVYQGQYNAIARNVEDGLIPVLRKYRIAFYAYSPAAGGIFSGSHQKTANDSSGRYNSAASTHHLPIGQLYSKWYLRRPILSAVDQAVKVAAEHGISGHAASLRWVAFHSVLDQRLGDGIVVGASSIKQLEQNLDVFEQGPLPREVANAFSLIYRQLGEDKVPYSV